MEIPVALITTGALLLFACTQEREERWANMDFHPASDETLSHYCDADDPVCGRNRNRGSINRNSNLSRNSNHH